MGQKTLNKEKAAVIFGAKNVTRMGYIDDYIFACEIKGEDHIRYDPPRRPKYHLVIIVLEGNIRIIINGKKFSFGKNAYINLPTWADIYEISYDDRFHAMVTATDRGIAQDIFRNRNPFPPAFKISIDHSIGGQIIDPSDVRTLKKDINNMIESLSNKEHRFAEEVNYAYFYILLTDMADMMCRLYETEAPSQHTDMRRADSILKSFTDLLAEHVATESSVDFYAEKLCISKQYLSLIVKEKTSVSVGRIISFMRVEEAARLLRDPEMTLQQIAGKLSFADQSSFGKFFRKHTGMTPLKYRQSLKKTLLTLH